jgi:hypothetical protein
MLSIVHRFYAMASDCTFCGETAEEVEQFAAATCSSKKNRDSPAATINALLKSMAGAIVTSLPPEPVGRPKEFRRSLSSPSGAWFAGSLSTAAMLKENDGAAWLQSLGVRHIVIAGMENIAAPSGRF